MTGAQTNFVAGRDGFKFRNVFSLPPGLARIELPHLVSGQGIRRLKLDQVFYGLCGGMCFAALDFLLAGIPIPDQEKVPGSADGSPLYRYLVRRQIDSLPTGVLFKLLRWMFWSEPTIQQLTAEQEWPQIRHSLDRGEPVVLVLLRPEGARNPICNHQVLASGYEFDRHARTARIQIYDPNHPGREAWLAVDLSDPQNGIRPRQSSGEGLQGFFINAYQQAEPPR